jgi:PAS domain S-box-containing protein
LQAGPRPLGAQRRGASRKDGGVVNNPLPVDPFSVAEAARRTWPALIEAMLEAVCLVEPEGLRIVAANGAAGRLLGEAPADLVGRDMLATAPTPEDEAFWQRVSDKRAPAHILSDSFVTRAGGQAVPVVRRVSRIEPAPGNALYVVALYDRSEQLRVESAAATSTAELAATLESITDGVLVLDLGGRIRNFNRRFSALWELPEEMLLLHADDEVLDWMRSRVESPAAYTRRLAEIEADPMLRATDTLRLRSGALVERVTLPQLSRGRPIGRGYSYRLSAAGAS